MIRYCTYDTATGAFCRFVLDKMFIQPDESYVEISDDRINPATWIWDVQTLSWSPDMDKLRTIKRGEAKTIRDRHADGGCMTAKGFVQTDADSQRKVNGAATGALIAKTMGAPFAIDWTMADDQVVPHSADEMLAMGGAVLQHLDHCQSVGTAIRAAIMAAPDIAALDSIDIEAGY